MKLQTWHALALAASILTGQVRAQSVGINEDHSAPNPNALLDLKSSNKGLLLPRLSTGGRLAIPNTKGLLVYDTTVSAFFYNTGAGWKSLLPSVGYWSLAGNSGVDSGFLGTTDNKPLQIRVSNRGSGRLDATTGNTYWGYSSDSVGIRDSAGNNNNTGFGNYSLTENLSGSFNTMTGRWTMPESSEATHNTGLGFVVLGHNKKGSFNTGTGYFSLRNNGTGSFNTTSGPFTLFSNISGGYNTATGFSALGSLTDGSYNTAFGDNAMNSVTGGSYNTGIGQSVFFNNTSGHDNIAFGLNAFQSNSSGSYNVASSYISLVSNTTGNNNTAIGPQTLQTNSTGNFNTAIGNFALQHNTTGSYNTALGDALGTSSTGSFNTGAGILADVSVDGLSNATAIGTQAVVNASNKVRIGGTFITVIEGQVNFTTPSDGRFKYDVKEDVQGLNFILQLRPVTYLFDQQRLHQQLNRNRTVSHRGSAPEGPDDAVRRSGFIAQEVEQAADRSGYQFSGITRPGTDQDYYSLSYESFVMPLVKGMQEQHRIMTAQDQQITELEKYMNDHREKYRKIAALQQEIADLGQLLNQINLKDEKK